MSENLPKETRNYWRDDRLNYDNVVLSNLTLQTSYMEDVARSNAETLEVHPVP